jgi:hypothetical protein
MPGFARELFTLMGRELQRVQERILLLIKSAQGRGAIRLGVDSVDKSPRLSTNGR